LGVFTISIHFQPYGKFRLNDLAKWLRAANFSYNAATSACGKGSAWEKALELFREMPERDVISRLEGK
jgi:pentatricopeptide repeat protein